MKIKHAVKSYRSIKTLNVYELSSDTILQVLEESEWYFEVQLRKEGILFDGISIIKIEQELFDVMVELEAWTYKDFCDKPKYNEDTLKELEELRRLKEKYESNRFL